MKEYKLFTPAKLGSILLKNRIVMSPTADEKRYTDYPNYLGIKNSIQHSWLLLTIIKYLG